MAAARGLKALTWGSLQIVRIRLTTPPERAVGRYGAPEKGRFLDIAAILGDLAKNVVVAPNPFDHLAHE
jgi:hypothetical protein